MRHITWIHSPVTIIGQIWHQDEGPQILFKIANILYLGPLSNHPSQCTNKSMAETVNHGIQVIWSSVLWRQENSQNLFANNRILAPCNYCHHP